MTLTPTVTIAFYAQVTPVDEVGVLDSYQAGLANGATTIDIPLATQSGGDEAVDQIVINDLSINGTGLTGTWTDWHLEPRMGVRPSYDYGAGAIDGNWWRNPEGVSVALDRIYGICVQLINDDEPEDFKAGAIITLSDAETFGDASAGDTDPHNVQIVVPDISGYVEGRGGAWLQVWPHGLILTPNTRITIDPQYNDAVYTLRICLMGRHAPITEWADATAYALGDVVDSTAFNYAESHRYVNIYGLHTSSAALNQPGVGSDWATYWRQLP